jgi:glycosyltransferase involved in cell wall biosynthesis
MNPSLDVIICTHNPRPDYLKRTLESLKHQTLDKGLWRLILVDNASEKPLKNDWDISWHPFGIHIYAAELGLTHARLAGIQQAEAELLVFVDDDNVLAPDYLAQALILANQMPFIGAFGGRIVGEYEQDLPKWMIPYQEALAVRDLKRSVWSNQYSWETCPAGAGMVIRKNVAISYANNLQHDKLRNMLGRKGKSLASAEDADIAFMALDMGYGTGRYLELHLLHLIDARRLKKSYILKLTESTAFSQIILDALRDEKIVPKKNFLLDFLKQMYRLLFRSYFEYQVSRARIKGHREGRLFLKKYIIKQV